MDAFDISASGLTANRLQMDTIASNLANVNTTRQADGSLGGYRRKSVIFAPILEQQMSQTGSTIPLKRSSLMMDSHAHGMLQARVSATSGQPPSGVNVVAISEDTQTPLKMVYDPSNPDAGPDGYVHYSNVNPVTEMVDMITASRAYEANVQALQASKSMDNAALNI
jgi:flagellar basal-body rod protein FlgC